MMITARASTIKTRTMFLLVESQPSTCCVIPDYKVSVFNRKVVLTMSMRFVALMEPSQII